MVLKHLILHLFHSIYCLNLYRPNEDPIRKLLNNISTYNVHNLPFRVFHYQLNYFASIYLNDLVCMYLKMVHLVNCFGRQE